MYKETMIHLFKYFDTKITRKDDVAKEITGTVKMQTENK